MKSSSLTYRFPKMGVTYGAGISLAQCRHLIARTQSIVSTPS